MLNNHPYIQEQLRQLDHSRRIYQMTDALIYALNIPSGMHLVPFLAPSKAFDNREAVAYWLRNELNDPDPEMSRLCVEVLAPRLMKRLNDIQEVLQ